VVKAIRVVAGMEEIETIKVAEATIGLKTTVTISSTNETMIPKVEGLTGKGLTVTSSATLTTRH
jgi:hypothetical protein